MEKEVKAPSRRGMLFGAVAASTAVAAIVALPKMAPQEVALEVLKSAPEKGGGYRVTAHVQQYYNTTLI